LGELGVLTIFAFWTVRQLSSAPGQLRGEAQGPDWLTDAVALANREAFRLGPFRPLATTFLDWVDHHVITHIRSHCLAFTAINSVLFGALVALSQGVQEEYPAAGFLLFFLVAACGFFAFAVLAGLYLGLLGDSYPDHSSRWRTTLTRVAIATCASVPVALGFRTVIWSFLGVSRTRFSWLALDVTALAAATIVAILTLTIELVRRRH
jgi:hypothetical protein